MKPRTPTVGSIRDFYRLMSEVGVASLFAERPGSVSGGEDGSPVEMQLGLASLKSIADKLYAEGKYEEIVAVVLVTEEGEDLGREALREAPGPLVREGVALHIDAHVKQAGAFLAMAKVLSGEVPVYSE